MDEMGINRVRQKYSLRHRRKVAVRDPVRFLVLGIIRRAVLDAAGRDCKAKKDVASAKDFLSSDDYREFCGWLGVRPSLVEQVQRLSIGEI